MENVYDKDLILTVDMYGCPNRCKHCWLGHLPNTTPQPNADRLLVDYFSPHFRSVAFYSWLREPDFCRDYKERWKRDNAISVNAKPQRFELASFWRIVRDEEYVDFLKSVGTETVQLTFFGLKSRTEEFVGRVGAFDELLKATEILIANNIAPRWQAFLYKSNIKEIVELLRLSEKLDLEKRCQAFGKHFGFFVHSGSCDGENAKLYNDRINKQDIPQELAGYYNNYDEVFSEKELFETLSSSDDHFVPHNDEVITLNITNNFDIYYNFTHITPEWKIGNILTDNKVELLDKIVGENILPLETARTVTIGEMVKKYGDHNSQRAFLRDDYLQFLLNRYTADNA